MSDRLKLFEDLKSLGVEVGSDVIVHSSFSKIRKEYDITVDEAIDTMIELVSPRGSLIMPTFTYCFFNKLGSGEIFDKRCTKSQTGIITECFRKRDDVIRTNSPTHSFAIWGRVKNYKEKFDNPKSPLGRNSILDWIANQKRSKILLLGADFTALSLGHYLEVISEVPYANIFAWSSYKIKPAGISVDGVTQLVQVPGCSKSFTNFQKYLEFIGHKCLTKTVSNNLTFLLIDVQSLMDVGVDYFKSNYKLLLCDDKNCKPCSERNAKLYKE